MRVRRSVVPQDGLPACAHTLEYWEPSAEATARAAEIVAAYDAHSAASLQLHEEICGASGDALNAACERVNEVAEAIRAMPVRTLAGVAVKAKLAKWKKAE